jgi:hypothetical protein
MLLPPAAPAVVALRTSHVVPHPGEARVARFDVPAHELTAVGYQAGKDFQQGTTSGHVEAVFHCDEVETGSLVGGLPPEPGCTHIIVNRHAHQCQPSEVVHRAAGSREVEVKDGDSFAAAEDDVLQAYIVVADDGCLAAWIG